MTTGRFINAPEANIIYNPDQVCYYQRDNNGKVKLHFTNGDSKDLEGAEARTFLAESERIPITPSQAA